MCAHTDRYIHMQRPPAEMGIFNPYTPLGVKASHVKQKINPRHNAISVLGEKSNKHLCILEKDVI